MAGDRWQEDRGVEHLVLGLGRQQAVELDNRRAIGRDSVPDQREGTGHGRGHQRRSLRLSRARRLASWSTRW
ncbi:MAG: hypothetical protein WA746_16435, partial [Isosphaeraceae bacterium]